MKKHFLFVCTSNLDRSKLAEKLFENSEKVEARSAGLFVFGQGANKVTNELIKWAGTIFVMDEKNEFHKTQLLEKFPVAEGKEIMVLEISRDIGKDREKLKKVLREKLGYFL
jgi:predicted protein tyrosine phosphatase